MKDAIKAIASLVLVVTLAVVGIWSIGHKAPTPADFKNALDRQGYRDVTLTGHRFIYPTRDRIEYNSGFRGKGLAGSEVTGVIVYSLGRGYSVSLD